MNVTQVLPHVLCTGLDNKLIVAACFGQNVPYSGSWQCQTVSILRSCRRAGKLCASVQVGRGQCDSSEDDAEGKKNEHREFRESLKLNKELI